MDPAGRSSTVVARPRYFVGPRCFKTVGSHSGVCQSGMWHFNARRAIPKSFICSIEQVIAGSNQHQGMTDSGAEPGEGRVYLKPSLQRRESCHFSSNSLPGEIDHWASAYNGSHPCRSSHTLHEPQINLSTRISCTVHIGLGHLPLCSLWWRFFVSFQPPLRGMYEFAGSRRLTLCSAG